MFNTNFPKLRGLWSRVKKYRTARQATGDDIIRRMHCACWITKARIPTHTQIIFNTLLPYGWTVPSGPGPPHYRDFTITPRHSTVSRIPLDGWSARPETSTWKHITLARETERHAVGGIRTRNPSKRAVAVPRPRPRGHWDRQYLRVISSQLIDSVWSRKMFCGNT